MMNFFYRYLLVVICILGSTASLKAQEMDEMWGDQVVKLRADDAERGQLFNDGNYAMFIHWGLYSHLGNKYKGKTYYGIGEWIMNPRVADIPYQEYMKIADDFNPTKFDADAIVKLAKDAGMKYVVITSKHHDGFAMFDSDCNDFNIVDATPWGRDPMKDLAVACQKYGLGLGFYYSHFQDWTYPGGGKSRALRKNGENAGFDYYYETKCKPQVEEITSMYGPIEIVWFDTPGGIPKNYVEELVAITRKNQPNALICGRAGHGLGDYASLGDMEVPNKNHDGMWETVDTTNDSWAYAWYDEYWKTPKDILQRLISTVGRGGTYMLNIGPRGDGSVPDRAQATLRKSGEWIQRYPYVVYGTSASPWGHALPWGDVTVKDNRLFLAIYEIPENRVLNLPGLMTEVISATLVEGGEKKPLNVSTQDGWTCIQLPQVISEKIIPVVEIELVSAANVDHSLGIDPSVETTLLTEFANVTNAKFHQIRWMEKFGEWKHAYQATEWKKDGKATWDVSVLQPGHYNVDLTYRGDKRVVWCVEIEGGEKIQNQQNASDHFQRFPIGWVHFPKPGRYKISVSCLEGDKKAAALKAAHFTYIEL
ncbi:MAG: alpha-L-fucosidase [Verrucomicrobiota bacterium]